METTREDVIIYCISCILAIPVALFIVWLFARIIAGACNTVYRFLYKIAPEGSFRRGCAGIALWIAMVGMVAWFMRDELKINNEQLFAFLSIWSLAIVIFAVLVKVLPDGIFKRVCGWIFLAVAFGPPLWLCFRHLGKGGRGNNRIWRHVSRGIQCAGAAGATAASKKERQKNRRSKKQSVDKKNS